MAERKRNFEPLPYFRWYWRDWRASRSVQAMHHVARAIYRELLDECWARGFIPDETAACAEIAGWPLRDVERHWSVIRAMFVPIEGDLLINERMENERTEMDRLRVERSIIGKRGGEASGRSRSKQNEPKGSKTKQNEPKGSKTKQNEASSSSSSSSSEQSKSSSGRLDSESPASAALAPRGARGAGMSPLDVEVDRYVARFGKPPVVQ